MKYFISFLIFLIFVVLSVIYIKISNPTISENKNLQIKNSNKTEMNVLKILKPEIKYSFPVRILFMKIGFNPFKYEIIYKITIKNTDKFALFNIRTILEDYNVHYSLFSSKKSEIYIFFKNLKQANTILRLFKEYNFNIEITKIKKRI